MAFTPFNGSGGGGSGSDDCTATNAQWRNGYTAIGLGTGDEPANGTIQDYAGQTAWTPSTAAQTIPVGGKYCTSNITVNAIPNQKADTGSIRLSADRTSASYTNGWYTNTHGADISLQEKTITPSTASQNVVPDSGRVLSKVTVNAIPGQTAGGNVTLNASTTSVTKASGSYLTSSYTVSVNVYNGSVT